MKTKPTPGAKLALLLASSLLAVGSAGAQSYSYFYGQNVQGGPYTDVSGLSAGFNMEQYNEQTNTLSSGAAASSIAPDPPALGGPQGFSTTVDLGSGWAQAHATPGFVETVTSVTLYLWVSDLSPLGGTTTFQIYSGLTGRDGTLVGDIVTLTEPTSELSFVALSIPASLWGGDFSIGKTGNNGTILWNTVTENGTDPTQLPGFAVTTTLVPIPEPSVTVLLGGLGVLVLVRRKRA